MRPIFQGAATCVRLSDAAAFWRLRAPYRLSARRWCWAMGMSRCCCLPAGVVVALQEQQLGTGHAWRRRSRSRLPAASRRYTLGDRRSAAELVDEHERSGAAATVLTMELDDPSGYGRILRGEDGSVLRIVEHRDATPEELAVHEVNSGMYVLPASLALEILGEVGDDNDQQEIYLTDVIAGLRERGERVTAWKVADASLVLGVNSQEELAEAESIMKRQLTRVAQAAGAGQVAGAEQSGAGDQRTDCRQQ